MNHLMNDALPRCTVPGSTCRLLQFEASGPRPVWAVLDGAGARRFTGQVTLHLQPTVNAYFQDGELYLAERDGDPALAVRLVDYGVVSTTDLEAGTVRLGAVAHLGRLFDRVPTVDRDQVELALELITGELLGEIADHTVTDTTVASYRHHPSGVHKWLRKVNIHIPTAEGHADHASDRSAAPATAVHEVTPLDQQIIDDFAAMTIQQAERAGEIVVETVAETVVEAETAPLLRLPEAPAYYRPIEPVPPVAPLSAPTPVAAAPAPVVAAPVATLTPPPPPTLVERPGAITQQMNLHDPELDAEPVPLRQRPLDVTPATPVAPQPRPVAEFDLSRVIDAVARENDGVSVPFGDDADIDDTVRAAVREALAEIEAATRPRPSDELSPAALQRALDAAGDAPGMPSPWTTDRVTGDDPRNDDLRNDGDPADDDDQAVSSETPAPGLRRLIGGTRKP
jgi:hypothetical protein